MQKLTIIIINYNTRDLLIRCLNSLDPGNLLKQFQICVIDNASPDGSSTAVKKQFPQVDLIALDDNKGFPYAANLGIKKHPSEFYLILNSDTEVSQENLDDILAFMTENPEIGAMTPFQYNNKNEPQLAWGTFPTFSSEVGRKIFQGSLDTGKNWAFRKIRKLKDPFCVQWISGSTMLLRDSALQKTGFFDESFFIFFEDIDLCKRISDAGWKIAVCPDIKVIHHRGEAAKTDSFNASLHYRRSQAYFWKKHHSRLSCHFIKCYLLFNFYIGLPIIAIKGFFNKNQKEHLAKKKENLRKMIETISRSFNK